ncbi:MAG TPA: SRPBCC family protein [Alphaproteobacteria bacterium]|nr:SRPBCC family protein [Alphaproteobacteria bacterium]
MARSCVSDIIAAPVDKVWSVVRDFGNLDYFAEAESCRLGDGETGSTVGAVRTVYLKSGLSAQERLLGLDDYYYRATYALIDNPKFAYTGYVATLQLTPLTTASATLLEWSASYEVAESDRADVAAFLEQGVYEKCIAGIKRKLNC